MALIAMLLTKHCSYRVATSIAHDFERHALFGWVNDGGCHKCLLKYIMCLLASLIKVKGNIIFQEIGQWMGYLGKIRDESSIEICVPEMPERASLLRDRTIWICCQP